MNATTPRLETQISDILKGVLYTINHLGLSSFTFSTSEVEGYQRDYSTGVAHPVYERTKFLVYSIIGIAVCGNKEHKFVAEFVANKSSSDEFRLDNSWKQGLMVLL